VLSGELAHKDSMGHGEPGSPQAGVIRPGDVQRMSAGTGVMHSEFNHAQDQVTHFLQIWIQPDRRGVTPGYEQKRFEDADKRGRLRLVASPDAAEGSVQIHAQARLYAGLFDAGEQTELALAPGRIAYVHLIRGALSANGQSLSAGDALQVADESRVVLADGQDAEVLVFDLAA
jgi:redox-sensitive bicupin YhaK (pirin superfamily)